LLRPSRFAVVGLIGIGVNALALLAFTEWLHIHYAVSAILASQVSTLHNFVLTELWVFGERDSRGHILVRYLAFNALNVSTLLIRVPVLVLFTEAAGLHYLVSNLIAIGVTFGVRYFIADNWIWAGRDARDQTAVDGWFNYSIHDLVRLRSRIALPELASFNVEEALRPDIEVERRSLLGGFFRLKVRVTSDASVICYREQLGFLGVSFDVRLEEPLRVDANWLLAWSHHVLYTNVVEPLLRFHLVSRGAVLLHAASVATERGALLMSAKTDTGKTSTLLRLLMQHPWAFMGDDMAILQPDGRVLSYPKPMTLSSHTMNAVNERSLPFADRVMLAIRSRLHSRQGRSIGQAIGRLPVPIVTINAAVQLVVPPPKYHVTSLVDCELASEAPMDAIILMERGTPELQSVELEGTLDQLLANTEDAYTFPPFAWFAPHLRFGTLDAAALRAREREILAAAVARARRFRLRVEGHAWAEAIPGVVSGSGAPTPVPVAGKAVAAETTPT
jgi:putative flippase GtrA